MYKEKLFFKIMTDFTPDINTLSKKDFIPSTITMKGIFSSKIDINILSNFLFVNHIFNKQNERVKLISGSRQSIEYFGPEGSIQATIFCLIATIVLLVLSHKEGKIIKPYWNK